MDDTEEEKVQLLESLRLQDAALSTTVDTPIADLDSDSDSELDAASDPQTFDAGPSEPERIHSKDDDSESAAEETIRDPSWSDALEANQEYDAILAELEAEIKTNLTKVSQQLDDVRSKISKVNNERITMNLKSQWIYVFGMPYFKTHDFYPCPYNKDYHLKKMNNEISWNDLPPYLQWTPQYKRVLNEAVRSLSVEKCEKEAQLKLAALRREADSAKKAGNIEKATELEKEIESFDVEAFTSATVDDVIANEDHDWLQISAKYLEGKQSPESCRNFWSLYLHPKINKAPYTAEEEKLLTSLAAKYEQQNWDLIAKELGTNRSGYQCFIVYQNKLNENIKRAAWEPHEDQRLVELVEQFRIGDYIPWAKVAYYLEGRTKIQAFNRWSYSVKPSIRKGRFTQEEDIMILVGVQMWGENFQRISHFLKDRTTSQIRDRYKHYLNRPDLGIPWTVNDDEKLLELVDRHGKSWKTIAKYFPSKDRTQVRHRHNSLLKFFAKKPNAPLIDAPCRCYNPQHYQDFQEHWDKAKKILNCNTLDDMVKAKNNLVTSLMKRKSRVVPPDPKKKRKPSVIEEDLVNYFRCSYDIPGANRKPVLKPGDAHKYANELASIVSLLKVNLNLPSLDELDGDTTLSNFDRDILKAYLCRSVEFIKDSPPPTPEEMPPPDTNSEKPGPEPVLCEVDVKPSCSSSTDLDLSADSSLNYIPSQDFAARYIDLPLLNFELNEVVADRNDDPSSYEIPTFDYIVQERVGSPPPTKEILVFPPNLTSMVALRTFLLMRRTLLQGANENISQVVEVNDDKLEEAKRKIDERLWSLFLWPALMSRHPPSCNDNVFIDEEPIVKKKKTISVTGSAKPKSSTKKTYDLKASNSSSASDGTATQNIAIPSTSGVSNAVAKSVKRKASNLGAASKRRKVALKVEDDDPDDPDEVVNLDQ